MIYLGENREAVLLLRFDAREGGRVTVFEPNGDGSGTSFSTGFGEEPTQTSTTRGEPTVSSGDWLVRAGTDESTEELMKDPRFTYRLYVLEQGQTPEDAGW